MSRHYIDLVQQLSLFQLFSGTKWPYSVDASLNLNQIKSNKQIFSFCFCLLFVENKILPRQTCRWSFSSYMWYSSGRCLQTKSGKLFSLFLAYKQMEYRALCTKTLISLNFTCFYSTHHLFRVKHIKLGVSGFIFDDISYRRNVIFGLRSFEKIEIRFIVLQYINTWNRNYVYFLLTSC